MLGKRKTIEADERIFGEMRPMGEFKGGVGHAAASGGQVGIGAIP